MPMSFERAADTDAVILVLRGINNEISYKELARQAGLTVGRTKEVLPSARRVLFNETKALFGTIRAHGLRRMTTEDKAKKPEAFKKRVFRGAGRELKHLASISDPEYNGLEKSAQHSVTTNRTVLHVLRRQAAVTAEPPKAKIDPTPLPDVTRLIPRKKEGE